MTKEDLQTMINTVDNMKCQLRFQRYEEDSEKLKLAEAKLAEASDALYSFKMQKIDEFIDHCSLWQKHVTDLKHDFSSWSETDACVVAYGLFGNPVVRIKKCDLMKDDYSKEEFLDLL